MSRAAWTVPLLLVALACGVTKDDGTDRDDDTAADSGTETGDDSGEVGELPPTGEGLYAVHCERCHGADGDGTDDGPELGAGVGRHSDGQLVNTILNGEGDMPAIGVTDDEAQLIVDYLRELFAS